MTIDLDRAASRPSIDVGLEPGPQRYRFGPQIDGDRTAFRLWAPTIASAELLIKGRDPVSMVRGPEGFLLASVESCGPGTRYKFRVGEHEFPDLASRQQDDDTSGWSVVRDVLRPSDREGPLRPWHEAIICEVHVGTASPEGTFNGLKARLEHFRDAGYTCLELMPVNEFPGSRNWGYDGTLIFAPENSYGTPNDLRALVDRAHELGLCMVLDVVYNHFGNVDNFVDRYAPEWFSRDIETPWGPGVNFNEEIVRQFYYENAVMWLREYDFDGLRFDAVHEIKADHRDQFLGDLSKTARHSKDHAKLIIENVQNAARWLDRTTVTNAPINFVAQWNDDIHHVLNQLVTGEGKDGYDDPSRDAIADLEKGLADGFVHDGEVDGPTDGRTRGEPASRLPPDAFITFVQNHDQIGNRADSKRLADRIGPEKLDFLHFLAFCAPQIPLFFMGEEGNLRSPFPFFVDLPEDLGNAKAETRLEEMAIVFNERVPEGGLPHPNDPATFERAKLPWTDFNHDENRAALERFRELARLRRELVWPLTRTICLASNSTRQGNGIIVNWVFEAGTLSMALNASDASTDLHCGLYGDPISTGEYDHQGNVMRLGPWSAVVWRQVNY